MMKSHLILKDRLEEMSLARQIIESSKVKIPVLKEDDNIYYGFTAINDYLDQSKLFIDKWYECRCDKYEFE